MPVIDIDGEKKKVACGPCIRGHRSSKCQHSDRVLIEVRKPGRPLSACPHPPGSCGCQRAVVYTVPKGESNTTPSGPLSPVIGTQSPHSQTGNRIQKSKLRKHPTGVSSSSLQRAIDSDPSVLSQQTNQKPDTGPSHELSESSSNVPSLVSSSSSTPQTEAMDTSLNSAPHLPSLSEAESGDSANRLQLGMLGIGGYGTTSDELGWSGNWPDYNSIPASTGSISNTNSKGGCSSSSTPSQESKPVVTTNSCCAGKSLRPADGQVFNAEQSTPRLSNTATPTIDLIGSEIPAPLPFEASAYSTSGANGMMFSEDQFGCLHEPDSSCQCGEGCECLGCSLHPANRTTTDYVRYHTELAMREWTESSQFPMGSHSAFGPPIGAYSLGHISQGFQGLGGALHGQDSFFLPTSQSLESYWPSYQGHTGNTMLDMSQFTSQQLTPLATPLVPIEPTRPRSSPLASSEHSEEQIRSHTRQMSMSESHLRNHESPGTEDDASTLSPSAFSVQQYNIPGCDDSTGSCLCGDGCQCEGCLTHSGHETGVAHVDISGVSRVADITTPT